MNVWTFTGSLGKDCETAASKAGKAYCKFSVAVNSGYGDNQKTTWANCFFSGKRAEGNLPQYLLKGQKVAISGELTLEQWASQSTGEKGSTLKVYVNTIDLIGEKKADSNQGQAPPQQQYQQAPQQQYQQAPQQQSTQGQQFQQPDFDDNIPF